MSNVALVTHVYPKLLLLLLLSRDLRVKPHKMARGGLSLMIEIRVNRRYNAQSIARWAAKGLQSGAAKLGTN